MYSSKALRLGALCMRFALIDRATLRSDAKTPESDTDHTVMLTVIACSMASELDGYDTGLAAEYATVHDLVEVYAGDTDSFDISEADAAAKDVREAEAIKHMIDDFGRDSWLMQRIREYEEQEVPEARLVRYLDKIVPKITHISNGCASLKRKGHTVEDLISFVQDQCAGLNREYPELIDVCAPLMMDLLQAAADAWCAKEEP